MLTISTYALEAMGYKPLKDGEKISAAFHLLLVYKVTGISLPVSERIFFKNQNLRAVGFSLLFGNSVNELSQELFKDNLVDDEEAWAKKYNASPLYMMIHVGPTEDFSVIKGYWRQSDQSIITHDCFIEPLAILRDLANRLLPTLLSSLSIRFSELPDPVKFEFVDRHAFGITPDGKTVQDHRISGNFKMSSSRRLDVDKAELLIRQSLELGKIISQKPVEFYNLGLMETDPLKRFLYFFLCMEIYTHETFKKIKHYQSVGSIFSVPGRLQSVGENFLCGQQSELKNVGDRFIWCAISVWKTLDNADVVKFRELLKLRNDIAHGNATKVPPDAVAAAQALTSKVLGEL